MIPPTPTGVIPPTAPPLPAAGLSGVVLLVEDDDAIRTLARRVLEMRGLTVLAVAGPQDALRAVADYPGRVDVLVADVLLPGMDGRDLAAAVRVGRPELKVVLMSGYPREDVFGPGQEDIQAEFLPKPFTPARLVEMLTRLLVPDTTPVPPGARGAALL